MIGDYDIHNLFREGGLQEFVDQDPHLQPLASLTYVHPLSWWEALDWTEPGIYILTGGRQIGKSTSLKLLIRDKLTRRQLAPTNVFYLPCDQLVRHEALTEQLRFILEMFDASKPFMLIIDEITFVKDWQRSIKALADEGWFRRGFCILTGSDSVILKEGMHSFPGRRGNADQTDFHLMPLTFHEVVELTKPRVARAPRAHIDEAFELFDRYLITGGYLRAINDMPVYQRVRPATTMTFEQWIQGDFEKRGKNVDTLLTVLQNIFEIGTSQVTFSALTTRAGTMSKETLIDYCRLLERMDLLLRLEAYNQSTRRGFPKKAQKLHFGDPFIRHTVAHLLQKAHRIRAADDASTVIEAAVAAQYARRFPCYYVKGTGEIDLVVVVKNRYLPLEVKWSERVRPNDLKEARKHKGTVVLGRRRHSGEIDGIPCHPLPLFLLETATEDQLWQMMKPA